MYIYIYILLLYKLTVHLCISCGKPSIPAKVCAITMVFREAPEPVVVLRQLSGAAVSSPNVTFSNGSAPACQK